MLRKYERCVWTTFLGTHQRLDPGFWIVSETAQTDSFSVTGSLFESLWNYDSGVWWWSWSLKEVVRSSASHMWFPPPGGRVKLKEGVLQGVVQLHNRGLVSTAVAVIGCWEDGDNVSVMRPVVPLHHQLMCPCDQSESVWVVEGLWYVLSKSVACTPRRDTPTPPVVGVTPEKVAHWAFMGHFL